MLSAPEKGRGTTGEGRSVDLPRRNHLGRAGSVPPLSHRTPKCFSLPVVLAPISCHQPLTRRFTVGTGVCACGIARLDLRKRSAGREAPENGTLEVGGRGGNGRRQPAATDRMAGTPLRSRSRRRSRWRSLRRSRRVLSVTCTLRHFPPRARRLTGSSGAKTGKSGVNR
jgi:hypothetical protein